MAGDGGDGRGAGEADGGVRVAETAGDGGEDLGEVWGERVAVGLGEERDEAEGEFPDGGLVGGVGGGDVGEELGDGGERECGGNGLELGGGGGVRVAIGELGQAREHPVPQVTRRLRIAG